jgi:hypothetical protein
MYGSKPITACNIGLVSEPKPTPCVWPGYQLPRHSPSRGQRGRKRGKGDWDKPRRLEAAALPSTPWGLGMQGKYSCTDKVANSQTMSPVPTL